jgi:hypothetical protein
MGFRALLLAAALSFALIATGVDADNPEDTFEGVLELSECLFVGQEEKDLFFGKKFPLCLVTESAAKP